jgi:hypothetical protein
VGGDQLSGRPSPRWGPDSRADGCVHENDEACFDGVEGEGVLIFQLSFTSAHVMGMVQEGPAVADIIRVLGRERTLSRLQ